MIAHPVIAAVEVSAHAPAKINLALHVTGRRADGYHEIETLAVFARFGDRVTVARSKVDAFEIGGPFADAVPTDGTNLVLRARNALRERCRDRPLDPVAITLQKNLPVASGVGGGSSDAAATLRALVELWRVDFTEAELAAIAAPLGADLPMCLAARPLLARGIGERVSLVADAEALGLVLVNPGVPVSTADVFARLTRRDSETLPPLPAMLDFHGLRNWLETARNDLEPAACAIQPAIRDALAALRKAGAGFARMSGSGATCFGLFETGNVAKRAAANIRNRYPAWFVAATRSIASENKSA